MNNSQFLCDAANWMVDRVNRQFPGQIIEFQFQAIPQVEFGDDVYLYVWTLTLSEQAYNPIAIDNYMSDMSDFLFRTHAILITYRLRREIDDDSDSF